MDTQIAKKYVKALLKALSKKETEELFKGLNRLVLAFEDHKFKDILLSPDISKSQKEEFILSSLQTKDKKIENFVKLLVSHKRLMDIPAIAGELDYQLSLRKNEFKGLIISNFKMKEPQIKKLEQTFSKKFNSTIKLENRITDYPGVKVEIGALGVEVGLSQDRLKAQLTEHILKAI